MTAPAPPALNESEFARLIRNAPLVSIDLICRDDQENILLLLRKEQPAKNYFFVPGGRIRKNERISNAFERIIAQELGYESKFADASFVGVHEHFYSTNKFEQDDYGTHYVVLVYEVRIKHANRIIVDDNHAASRWVSASELLQMPDVHEHVRAYFRGTSAVGARR